MADTAPGTGPTLVNDAHYHAIKATATWAAWATAMEKLATESPAETARERAERVRETTYYRRRLTS